MRKSFCLLIMLLIPAIVIGRNTQQAMEKSWTPQAIDNAWIRVPWSHGGYYYHNTLTREDQDHPPNCLSKNCKWNQ